MLNKYPTTMKSCYLNLMMSANSGYDIPGSDDISEDYSRAEFELNRYEIMTLCQSLNFYGSLSSLFVLLFATFNCTVSSG